MQLTKDRTALLVVDMQNGFCHVEGSLAARRELDISGLAAAVPGCVRLVAAARAAGVPVIFTRFVYRADFRDGGVLIEHFQPWLAEVNALVEGTWDMEIIDELQPAGDEFVIDKNRCSSFYGTRLEPILTSLGIKQLLIAGVTTNMCVETTVRDASQRDYEVFVATDACGELEEERHRVALNSMGFGFAKLVSVDEVVGVLESGPMRVA